MIVRISRSPPERWQWVALAIAILCLDYLSGPFVQFPILFVFPVILATWRDGRAWGIATGVVLPMVRLAFTAHWGAPSSLPLEILDQLVDVMILVGFALAAHRFVLQEREIRVLEGLLPICGFCKRIRTEDQNWQQLEQFITSKSEARFSHTFCPECGRQHYGEYLE